MTTNPLPRRSLLSGLLGSIAGLAAGLMGGRAKASPTSRPDYPDYSKGYMRRKADDLKAMEAATGTLKLVETSLLRYEYQLVWRVADSGSCHPYFPAFDNLDQAIRARNGFSIFDRATAEHVWASGEVEIRKRPVGDWETMEL